MSIRLRLALWYGALAGLAVLLVALVTYALHARGHYDDLDQMLVSHADHAAEEYATHGGTERFALIQAPSAAGVLLRLVAPDGRVLAATTGAGDAPSADGAAPGPAFDALAGLAPAFAAVDPGDGQLGVVSGAPGDRWRAYARPLPGSDARLIALAPLEPIDRSIEAFRRAMCALVMGAVLGTFALAYALAARVLQPIATLTEAAGGIAHSRDFARRVPVAPRRDELGRLAATFNGMLSSLEEAYEAQRRFVSDASHELRAPLTAIQGNLELLERHPGMPVEERAEAVGEASREAHRLTRLVGDLLALARADAGVALRREPVALHDVVVDAFGQTRHLCHGQSVALDAVEPVTVVGDAERLKQLLVALLDNAVRYTPPGGEVRVGMRRANGMAEVTVADTGVGIDADDLPRVFERFYRADPARSRDSGGTGLGLPIARWIARQHGGDVHLDSAPGRGTTATLRVPVAA